MYRMAQNFCPASRREHGRIAGLCAHDRNKEDGKKGKPAGIFFDRDHLNTQRWKRGAHTLSSPLLTFEGFIHILADR